MTTAQTPAMAGINPGEHGHEQANPGEIAIGVIIGRTSEFFDFFVYAIASVIVFPRLVFPFASELTGTLYSFAIFIPLPSSRSRSWRGRSAPSSS